MATENFVLHSLPLEIHHSQKHIFHAAAHLPSVQQLSSLLITKVSFKSQQSCIWGTCTGSFFVGSAIFSGRGHFGQRRLLSGSIIKKIKKIAAIDIIFPLLSLFVCRQLLEPLSEQLSAVSPPFGYDLWSVWRYGTAGRFPPILDYLRFLHWILNDAEQNKQLSVTAFLSATPFTNVKYICCQRNGELHF